MNLLETPRLVRASTFPLDAGGSLPSITACEEAGKGAAPVAIRRLESTHLPQCDKRVSTVQWTSRKLDSSGGSDLMVLVSEPRQPSFKLPDRAEVSVRLARQRPLWRAGPLLPPSPPHSPGGAATAMPCRSSRVLEREGRDPPKCPPGMDDGGLRGSTADSRRSPATFSLLARGLFSVGSIAQGGSRTRRVSRGSEVATHVPSSSILLHRRRRLSPRSDICYCSFAACGIVSSSCPAVTHLYLLRVML